jgi:predicted O-methyltransferase YrrM
MSQEQWTAVDQYISDMLIPSDSVLDEALKASADAGLPEIQVAPNQGKLLMLLAQIHKAKTILEIGTLGGYSTIWLARALPADGSLITLELDPKHAEVATANIARAGLSEKVDVRV